MGEQEQDTEARKPTPENATLFQAFEWNVPADQKHWKRLLQQLPALKAIGIDNIWLPPGCKAASPEGNGYDIYDLYDLGEFDQKGTRATKWGSFEELKELANAAKEQGIGLYWDAVLNHKAGADYKERCRVVEVDEQDRNKEVGEPYEMEAWLGFDFPGRGEKYSAMKYHWEHFSGTDWDAEGERKGVFKILGENKGWSRSVDDEKGNADYMMFADLDYDHPDVCEDVKRWGVWITKELGLKGFRLDAVQHFSERFTNEWVDEVNRECGNKFYVGEFWIGDVKTLTDWLEQLHQKFALYDAPLLYNFSNASQQEEADLRKILDNTLVQSQPVNAVTVVMNHDTQPGQTVATPVTSFFKPLAYAIILLRNAGYPCPFYGDLYGLRGRGEDDVPSEPPSCGGKLADLILARKLYAYGDQDDYFDAPTCIGWVRRGTWDRPAGCAVLLSNAAESEKRMCVGSLHCGEVWTDLLGWSDREVTIDEQGYGVFPVAAMSVSVFVRRDAEGRDRFPTAFDSNIYQDGGK